jgi:hypothetical protein
MTKATPDNENPIERLLQDRAQFVNWLARLNSPGDAAGSVPESVRARVRSDYQRRLDAVLQELRGHVTLIEEQVGDLTARHGALTHREQEQQEQLAEAEVRHLVGEYDERLWDGIRAERMKVIAQVRDELLQTSTEITRLSEVLATIRAPVPPDTSSAPAAPPLSVSAPRPPVRVPEPPPPERDAPPARPAAAAGPQAQAEIPFKAPPKPPQPAPAPAPAPKPPAKKEDAPGRTLWFPSGKPTEAPAPGGGGGGKVDELAFIKSIDAPPTPTPPKSRPSGGFIKADNALTPPPEPAPRPAAPAPAAPEPPKDRASQGAGQKTLKCGDCGTLNRPTEWYCERCGAELAAL